MPLTVWLIFFVIYLALLVLDLAVLNRESQIISVTRALCATLMWIAVAMLFAALIFALYHYHWFGIDTPLTGQQALTQFITGYVLEWSLSVDNIFVIAVILTYMKIPVQHQYRVLFWGIVGSFVLRGLMIIAGAALIHSFDWMFYIFGLILLWSAFELMRSNDKFDPESSFLMRMLKHLLPVSDSFHDDHFFVTINQRCMATPLLVTLLFVDLADAVFAVDSIPAIFAVTQDTFLVFTSNAFAILGLRALYFAVAGLIKLFKYLKISLIIVLGLIGIKMLLHSYIQISDSLSLAIIIGILLAGMMLSVWSEKGEKTK